MNESISLMQRAQKVIPGGVNSPVRSCKSVECPPLFIKKGSGSKILTEDGQTLVDYVMSWGPLILGHADPEVNLAAAEALKNGVSFGAPCRAEVELAEMVCFLMPGVEMIRMVNSGTEATMSALRLARGFTGREGVVMFEGCYHGHADYFLAGAGSGLATLSIPASPGVPEAVVKNTFVLPYNNLEAVEELFAERGAEIAGLIVEPVAGNMGVVAPNEGFLEGLRDITNKHGALLIFDEVITGFRLGIGGANKKFKVTPDLVTLGKILGGGFPVGAYGGAKKIMQKMAPEGSIYQAGTLSGNPVAMAAGLATLKRLLKADYASLDAYAEKLTKGLKNILAAKAPTLLNRVGSLFTIFFTTSAVKDFTSAKRTNTQKYASFYRQMRERGINFAPSAFEAAFVSFAHTEEDLEKTLEAAEQVVF